MTASPPMISVFIPNYNHGRFLPQALDSLLTQTLAADEIVVIDDGSTDDSVAVVEAYMRRMPSLRLLRNPRNMGVMHTTNRGLAEVKGDMLFPLASDDWFMPRYIERGAALLEKYPGAGLCALRTFVFNEEGEARGVLPPRAVMANDGYIPPESLSASFLEHGCWIQGNSTPFRRKSILEVGGYRSEAGPYADLLAHVLSAARFGACYSPEPLGCWRRAESSYSASLSRSPAWALGCLAYARDRMNEAGLDLFAEEWARGQVLALLRPYFLDPDRRKAGAAALAGSGLKRGWPEHAFEGWAKLFPGLTGPAFRLLQFFRQPPRERGRVAGIKFFGRGEKGVETS